MHKRSLDSSFFGSFGAGGSQVGLADVPDPPAEEVPDVDAWESVSRSRRRDRPGVRRFLKYAATDVIPLNGTGQGESDPGLLIALARFGDSPCVFLGQDRRGQTEAHPLGPGALREARRGMRLAAELGLPLMTVIDTHGASLSAEAEEGGLAGEIARAARDAGLPGARIGVFDDNRGAIAFMRDFVKSGDVVLVKGSRAARMEEIVASLSEGGLT